MKKTLFIKNAAYLTASGIILRLLGIAFKVYLAGKIGADGIGLYQLAFSVFALGATFASAGVCTAVTRLLADELILGSRKSIKTILSKCILVSLYIAIVSTLILFFGSRFIAGKILGEIKLALPLKAVSLSLPFIGVCSCLRGYFSARRKAFPISFSQVFEQTIRITTIFTGLALFSKYGVFASLTAVMLGDTLSEALCCLLLFALYKRDILKIPQKGREQTGYSILKSVKHIALPITLGRYLNSFLRTAENILVPKFLAKNPLLGKSALSLFGMIKGMALPILFFPSSLISSVSALLLPEISEAYTLGRKTLLKESCEKIISLTLILGLFCGAVFFFEGEKIGLLLYKSGEVGYLLCYLSPIVALMYLDGICDGILKGLDCQKFTFFSSVGDSALRLLLLPLILPRFGALGFIGIMYFSNFFTCFLNTGRLISVTKAQIGLFKTIILPLCLSFLSVRGIGLLLSLFSASDLVYIILLCLFSLITYTALILVFKCISIEDIKDLR